MLDTMYQLTPLTSYMYDFGRKTALSLNCRELDNFNLGTKQNLSLYGAGAKGDRADTFSELHGSGAQGFFRG